MATKLTFEEKEVLIEAVSVFPALYDNANENYWNKNVSEDRRRSEWTDSNSRSIHNLNCSQDMQQVILRVLCNTWIWSDDNDTVSGIAIFDTTAVAASHVFSCSVCFAVYFWFFTLFPDTFCTIMCDVMRCCQLFISFLHPMLSFRVCVCRILLFPTAWNTAAVAMLRQA